jgi:hypothetical protein
MNLQDIKEKLSKNFLKYGFLPYVYLLEELQAEEQYELCAVVMQIVQEKNIKFDLQLPTHYNDDSIAIFLKEMRNSPNKGYIALRNIPYYAGELKELIK